MIKKLGISLVIIFIIYTVAWFVIANIAEKKIHSSIKGLESAGTIKNYSGNIHISGYPFKFAINFEYPSLILPCNDHDGQYNFLYDGNLKLVLGFFSDSIKLRTDGTLHLKGHINDYNFYLVTSGEDSEYKVKLHDFLLSPSLIKNFTNSSKSSMDMIFDTLKYASIRIHNFKIINKTTNNLVANIEDSYFMLTTKKDDGYYLSYKEKDTNVEFTSESVAIWQHAKTIPVINKIIKNIPRNITDYFSVFTLDKMGLINYDARFKINVGSEDLEVYIDRFNLNDKLENISLEGKVINAANSFAIDLSGKMSFSQKWYDLMRVYVNSTSFDNARFDIFGDTNDQSIVSKIFTPIDRFLNTNINGNKGNKDFYIPKLHKMGEISIAAKTKYSALASNDFSLEIDKFQLSTDMFSLGLSGDLDNKDDKDSYDFDLEVKNYPIIVDTIIGYVNRVIRGSSYNILVAGKHFEINEKTSGKIKDLLRKISNAPNKVDTSLKITLKKKNSEKYPSAGKYSSAEFGRLWNLFIAELVVDKIQSVVGDIANKLQKNDTLTDAGRRVSFTVNHLLQNVFG
jgi:hypothetical protein